VACSDLKLFWNYEYFYIYDRSPCTELGPLQVLCLHRMAQHIKTLVMYLCLKWNSNPLYQFFSVKDARLLDWRATVMSIKCAWNKIWTAVNIFWPVLSICTYKGTRSIVTLPFSSGLVVSVDSSLNFWSKYVSDILNYQYFSTFSLSHLLFRLVLSSCSAQEFLYVRSFELAPVWYLNGSMKQNVNLIS
jgi:hypothetical protein